MTDVDPTAPTELDDSPSAGPEHPASAQPADSAERHLAELLRNLPVGNEPVEPAMDPVDEELTDGSPGQPADGAEHHLAKLLREVRDGVEQRTDTSPSLRGQALGRFIVLGTLGSGGMGTVLRAYDEKLDRKIAIKVLHAGTSKQHTKRLLREAQALAKLSHPNVVQVYEVGEVGDQVFIAMELVKGEPLDRWQARERSWRECTKVYLEAGQGLAAAHAVGLVHRDFKPHNCIVDEQGRARVLDFGLARDVNVSIDETPSMVGLRTVTDAVGSSLTKSGTVMGTWAYMPLEQMHGQIADKRADQFSFCVSLYEAVYAERPFEGRTMLALMESIEGDNVRPAPKGSKVPAKLRAVLLRGLAAEPERRWPSMEALLEELRKLVAPRRGRWLVLGVTVGLVAIGVGQALARYAEVMDRCTGAQAELEGIWDNARKQEVKTAILGTELVYAPDTWDRVEHRLDEYTAAWTNKHTDVCEATSVRQEQSNEVMDLRMSCLRERRTAMRAAVDVLAKADGQAAEKAVELVADLPLLDRCDDVERLEEQHQRVPPPEDLELAREVETLRERLADIKAEAEAGKVKVVLPLEAVEPVVERAKVLEYGPLWAEAKALRGALRIKNGRYMEAEQDLLEAHDVAMEHRHDEVALLTAQRLTVVVGSMQARHAEGRVWGRAALAHAKRSGEDVALASSLRSLAVVLRAQGEYEQALLHFDQALRIREETLGAEHPSVATSLNDLGNVLADQGEYEQAMLHFDQALRIREKALGASHPDVAESLNDLGNVLADQGKYEQALFHLERALRIREGALGASHPNLAIGLSNLGIVLADQGEYEQARIQHERALRITEEALGAAHPDLALSLNNLGGVLYAQGAYEQALMHYERALKILEEALGSDHPDLALSLGNVGIVLAEQGKYEQALPYFERAIRISEKALGANHPVVAQNLNNLGGVLYAKRDYEQALPHFKRAVQIKEEMLGSDHPSVAMSLDNLGNVFSRIGEYEQALRHYERALKIREKTVGADHPELGTSLNNLAEAFESHGDYVQALLHYERALWIWEKALGADHSDLAYPLVGLAKVALVKKDFNTARPYAERAISIREASKVPAELLAETRFVLAQALWPDHSQRTRARELAEYARAAYASVGKGFENEIARVEIWLAEHHVR
ncbi:tetratricopeptide repeat-containing serine/threonine-protein kinase [Paraliomyxa miuraensis]|uniref:tetratricopeptide repeat-containing serine/threonine-protein kinase n=1 Tax=Paraliomyxa miuraensis TaxID=376150 RepID=UPI0022509523|nr:tetratricopeptide repeat-containing serine/threonine-protein kinase [Paraliomyxa miuraensis]MCX4239185.1 tetratricopeptide repeat-containing serine/threonine-protein kinase [Paraliomyxa miuraensis]